VLGRRLLRLSHQLRRIAQRNKKIRCQSGQHQITRGNARSGMPGSGFVRYSVRARPPGYAAVGAMRKLNLGG
jgi:hypothetical protein